MEEINMSTPANEPTTTPQDLKDVAVAPHPRKAYRRPVLEPLGDIRDVTMGGSLGAGESGMGGKTRKP
jgi:hypothetical protein